MTAILYNITRESRKRLFYGIFSRQQVKDILKNPAAAAVLDKYSPDASRNPQMKLVGGLTLRKLASFPQSAFLKPHLEELDKELQAIE